MEGFTPNMFNWPRNVLENRIKIKIGQIVLSDTLIKLIFVQTIIKGEL